MLFILMSIFIYLRVSMCVFACIHVCVSLSPRAFLPLSVFNFVSVSLGKQGQLSKKMKFPAKLP